MSGWRLETGGALLDREKVLSYRFDGAKLTGLAVWTSAWTRRAVDGLRFAPVPYTVVLDVL